MGECCSVAYVNIQTIQAKLLQLAEHRFTEQIEERLKFRRTDEFIRT